MTGKKITLEDLALMVHKGFLEQGDEHKAMREESATEHAAMRAENLAEHKAMREESAKEHKAMRAESKAEHTELRHQLGEMVTHTEYEQLKTRIRILETATL